MPPSPPQDRLDALQRDQLADEERDETVRRGPVRSEEPVLGADEADGHFIEPCEPGEEVRIRRRVCDDDVGGAKRPAVDGLESACRE